MFGCEYRGGRSTAAPLARAGATSSKGELLHLQSRVKDPVQWDGRTFERDLASEDLLPEAYGSQEGILPHMHRDMEARYPQAIACTATGDVDPPEDDTLEARGRLIGSRMQRYR